MRKSRIDLNLSGFPAVLRPLLQGGTLYDSSCHSSARVCYCDTGYFIKTDEKGALAREAEMTRYFHKLGLGVEVMAYLSDDRDWLATRSARGLDLTHWPEDPESLCQVLAQSLRRLHSIPAGDAPLSASYRHYLDTASGSFSGGAWDPSFRLEQFPIASKEDAWAVMQANKDRLRADTLIHGDACLPNILHEDGKFASFIDLGQSGAGDRHIDLYWAVWSLAYNLKTEAYTDYFLDQYGRDQFDAEILRAVAAFELFG